MSDFNNGQNQGKYIKMVKTYFIEGRNRGS